MTATAHSGLRLMIVDDDLLSREVLGLLAAEAGFDITLCDSGETALETLAHASGPLPDVILADMQMPGVSGDSLARLLRAECGTHTLLLAMSGSAAPASETHASEIQSYDRFLLKPFSIDDLNNAIDLQTATPTAPPVASTDAAVLSPATYAAFTQSMSSEQVRQLYTMCLDDADARIASMRSARAANDADAFRRAAHSIKGGCGMVGALQLAALAADMELNGPQRVDARDPLNEFLSASAHLRRILDAQQT